MGNKQQNASSNCVRFISYILLPTSCLEIHKCIVIRADILLHADVALVDTKGALLFLCESMRRLCLAKGSSSASDYFFL